MMNLEKSAEKLMSMSDDVWMRHANPWSGYTRMATTPFYFLAIWSHVWIGWWALLPCALLAVWTWLNPRIFPAPGSTDNWMSKGVMGERVYLNRKSVPIPAHHVVWATILSSASLVCLLVAAYGFVVQDFWAAFLGFHMAGAFKIWFVDRMVWLYDDMAPTHPDYAAWLKRP